MRKQQILSADFETTTILKNSNESNEEYRERVKKFQPLVYSWAIAKRTGFKDYEIKDGISVFSFIEYLSEIDMDTKMYFHNGSKFDLHFIIPYLDYMGYKQVIFQPNNISEGSDYDFSDIEKNENIIVEEKFRPLNESEYTMLIDGSHKIMEMKIGLKSKKRKKGNIYQNRILHILDSNLMFPSTLKGYGETLNKEYNTKDFSKLDLEDGYTKEMQYKTYEEFKNDGNQQKYLHRDVEILIEFLYLMNEAIPFHKWKITAAGTAYSIWKKDFIGTKLIQEAIDSNEIVEVKNERGFINYRWANSKYIKPKKYFVDNLFKKLFPVSWMDSFHITGIDSNFNFLHKSYQGGLTMANPKHAGKIIEDVVYIDINSSYPTQMKYNKFPCGIPSIGDDGDPDSIKLINLKIENVVNDKGLPFLYDFLNINGGKHYPKKLKWKDYLITDIEFERFKKYYKGNYTYEVALSFNSISGEYIFGDYIDFFYKLKSKKGVSNAEKIYAKLMLNSLYGKFGQDVTRKSKLYLNGEWLTYETISKTKFYLPLASYISAYARMYMVDAVDYNFENVIGLDTDSLSIKIPKEIYNSNEETIKNYMESNYQVKLDSNKIGYWDIEHMISKINFRRAKQYLFINNQGEKIIKFAGLRLNKQQLEDLSFKEFVLGKKNIEQLRPFRTPTGLILEEYDKELKPIWEYNLNPDYWFKDEKTFLEKTDFKKFK